MPAVNAKPIESGGKTPKGGKQGSGAVRHARMNKGATGAPENLNGFPKKMGK